MSTPPQIFDRTLLKMRRLKALRTHGADADFLLSHVCEDMLDRLSLVLRPFPTILELGGHTGQLANALRMREGTERVIRQEHHQDFFAQDPASASHTIPLQTVVGDEEALAFKAHSIDMIISPLSLHWVNDLPGSLFQIRNSLKPDGLFLATLLGNESLKELRTAFLQAESEQSGGASPRIAPFPELKDVGALLQRAGFALPVADQDILTVRYKSMFDLLQDLRKMGAGNALATRSRKSLHRDVLMRAAQIYQEQFSDDDGKIRATFQILSLSGWAPHESQQKPLQPGSAKTHLSQILKDKSEPH